MVQEPDSASVTDLYEKMLNAFGPEEDGPVVYDGFAQCVMQFIYQAGLAPPCHSLPLPPLLTLTSGLGSPGFCLT